VAARSAYKVFSKGGAGGDHMVVPDICLQKVSPKVQILHLVMIRRT
jgi:hypothetical protein